MVKMLDESELYEKRKECRHFNDCSAPFCPVAMNTGAVWLSEDEICSRHDFKDSIIIRNQSKIKRKSGDPSKYFNYKMLSMEFVIRKGILGIEPAVPESLKENQSFYNTSTVDMACFITINFFPGPAI